MAVVLVIFRNHQCLWMWCKSRCSGRSPPGLVCTPGRSPPGLVCIPGSSRHGILFRRLHAVVLHQILQCQKLRQLILRHPLLYHLRIVIRTFEIHAVRLRITYMLQALQALDKLRQTLLLFPGKCFFILCILCFIFCKPCIQLLPCFGKLLRIYHILIFLTCGEVGKGIRQLL